MKQELIKGLTPEQAEKVKACKSQDELLALAKAEGIELTDEQLEAVSGGMCTSSIDVPCPDCNSADHVKKVQLKGCSGKTYKCTKCNIQWTIW